MAVTNQIKYTGHVRDTPLSDSPEVIWNYIFGSILFLLITAVVLLFLTETIEYIVKKLKDRYYETKQK